MIGEALLAKIATIPDDPGCYLWKDAEARKQMPAIFNLAAGDADLVSEYRRRLASTLH